MTGLQITWFVITGVFVCVYAILDGFDLGIGILYPVMGRGEEQRAGLHEAVAPVWDGNEVWLILVGGVLFAVFPAAYAAVLSGFYLIFMLILFGLIVRAAALGLFYRGAAGSKRWVAAFSGGSLVAAFLLGLVVGNLVRGVRLTPSGDLADGVAYLFNPFAIAVGVLGLAMFANQGAGWAALKTEGETHRYAVRTRWITGWVLLGLLTAVTLYAVFAAGDHAQTLTTRALGWVTVGLAVVGIAGQQVLGRMGHDVTAFIGASVSVAGLVGIWIVGAFPVIVPALNGEALSLTVENAAAPHGSLVAMTVVGGIGVPVIAVCMVLVYRVFRGRSRKTGEGY